MIRNKKIKNVDIHIMGIQQGDDFYVGKKVDEVSSNLLKKIGFPDNATEGIKLLGRIVGPVSRLNVNGSYIRLRDRPKEIKYREICVKDWHGNYHYVDIPYERYQRLEIPAPEAELQTAMINNELFIISERLTHTEANNARNRHVINLFLEYFGDCEVFNAQLRTTLAEIPVRRVNWEILPQGEYPWERIPSDGIKKDGSSQRILQRHTYDTIKHFHPTSITIGTGGFRGYIVFAFPEKNLFILENMLYGNATYVFDNNWEEFSQLSKGEILNSGLLQERIVHREGWESSISRLFS